MTELVQVKDILEGTLSTLTVKTNSTTLPSTEIEVVNTTEMAKVHFCRCKAEWFVKDGLGITCSGITYGLILFAEFVVVGVILLPGFPLSAWSYIHAILFSVLAFLAACSHLRAMTTNPVILFIISFSNYMLF